MLGDRKTQDAPAPPAPPRVALKTPYAPHNGPTITLFTRLAVRDHVLASPNAKGILITRWLIKGGPRLRPLALAAVLQVVALVPQDRRTFRPVDCNPLTNADPLLRVGVRTRASSGPGDLGAGISRPRLRERHSWYSRPEAPRS